MPTATVPQILGFALVAAVLALDAVDSAYSPDGAEPHKHLGIWVLTVLCACAWLLTPGGPYYLWAAPTVIALAASVVTTFATRRRRNAA